MTSTATDNGPAINTQDHLKALTFQRLHPRTYLERFLQEDVRPDGRAFGGWRDVSMNVGSISTADGSALVRLGDTTVVCGVKAEIAEPDIDHPSDGFLVPNLDLSAGCSPRFKPGLPGEEAQVLSHRLNEILSLSQVLPLSSLCIHEGKAVWVLYVDATCINYDGNAFDATLIAMVAALKNTRLPKASFDEESGKTTCTRRVMTPLVISRSPISMSFGIFDSMYLLADPTSFEEPMLDTVISIIIDDDGELMSVNQLGLGVAGSQDVLSDCIAAAKNRCGALRKQLRDI